MKKKNLLFLLTIMLSFSSLTSCVSGAAMYVIQEKKDSGTSEMCEYWFNRPAKWPLGRFPQYSYVIDSCSKYQLGDDWEFMQHKVNK